MNRGALFSHIWQRHPFRAEDLHLFFLLFEAPVVLYKIISSFNQYPFFDDTSNTCLRPHIRLLMNKNDN